MRELIESFYNIRIISFDNDYIKDANNTYIFKCIDEVDKLRISYIINFSSNLYKFVLNKFQSIYSSIKGKDYVLIMLDESYSDTIDFVDTLDFYTNSERLLENKSINVYSWEYLWENKIDYLSKVYMDNYVQYKDISSIFYYYIGVAENALSYIKKINIESIEHSVRLSLCHHRINYPIKKEDFYNPLNIAIDLRIRDISEYIKSCFYANENYENELLFFLRTMDLSKYESSLLFARILYPSKFIDYFLSNKKANNNIFSDTNKYEKFLKKTYELINSYVLIDNVSWITDQH